MESTRASLILRIQNAQDLEAWAEFAAIYSPVIYRVAIGRGFQSADAENLVQEVLASVAKSVSLWLDRDDRGSFRAWLFRIARNKSVDMMTRRATRPLGQDGEAGAREIAQLPAPNDLSQELEREYGISVFQRAAEKVQETVTSENWQAFWMTSVEGQSIAEVAELLSVTTGQIYCARSRVMSKIKNWVQEYEARE